MDQPIGYFLMEELSIFGMNSHQTSHSLVRF